MRVPDTIRQERLKGRRLYLCEGVDADAVLNALDTPGEILKDGDKRIVRKVGDWVIKESHFNRGITPIKMTVNPNRYRNGLLASLEMMRLDLPIPNTIAYVEHCVAGVILSNAFIYEYIPDAVHLREFSHAMDETQRESCHRDVFIGLAKVLQQLADARVIHRDLKPLNILTEDGHQFYLIDLDEAFCDIEPKPEHLQRNLVQILDGMHNTWTREQYDVLVEATIPPGKSMESWKKWVWDAVDARAASGKCY